MPVRPDFVIAGAPKCGTTSLFRYLSHHPSIFMPRLKEANYFCTDLKTSGGVRDAQAYRALFARAAAGQVAGEASAIYLYSKAAVANLMAHNPAAKVIVLLRNPVEAAHSLHAAAWSHGHENIADFAGAWRAQSDRLAGLRMPPRWPEPLTLQYGPVYRYAEQVRRLFDLVPPDQRRVFLFEEFFADPQRHFWEVLRFLGVPPVRSAAFPVANPAIGPRSRRIDRLLRQPPEWLLDMYGPLKPAFRRLKFSPRALLWRLNSAPRDKAALTPELRAELECYFADDIAELEQILGRRLWR